MRRFGSTSRIRDARAWRSGTRGGLTEGNEEKKEEEERAGEDGKEQGADFRNALLVLTLASNADKLSAVKTFTVRELDRVPNEVLDASDLDGAAKIRRRNGRTYTIRPDQGSERIKAVPNIRARLAKVFPKQIPIAQSRAVDKLLAGE